MALAMPASGSFSKQQQVNQSEGVFVLRFPLRVFDKLTATVSALVVLLATADCAVLRDIVRATSRAGHFWSNWHCITAVQELYRIFLYPLP